MFSVCTRISVQKQAISRVSAARKHRLAPRRPPWSGTSAKRIASDCGAEVVETASFSVPGFLIGGGLPHAVRNRLPAAVSARHEGLSHLEPISFGHWRTAAFRQKIVIYSFDIRLAGLHLVCFRVTRRRIRRLVTFENPVGIDVRDPNVYLILFLLCFYLGFLRRAQT
jgi:hypothetical protein